MYLSTNTSMSFSSGLLSSQPVFVFGIALIPGQHLSPGLVGLVRAPWGLSRLLWLAALPSSVLMAPLSLLPELQLFLLLEQFCLSEVCDL